MTGKAGVSDHAQRTWFSEVNKRDGKELSPSLFRNIYRFISFTIIVPRTNIIAITAPIEPQ